MTSPSDATLSQSEVDAEIAALGSASGTPAITGAVRVDYPPYRSSALRHPSKALHQVDPEALELHSPVFSHRDVSRTESDLTIHPTGEPLGERIRISGRVTDGDGRPVRRQLVEVWQANAGGRYIHQRDQHPAPLDPHFTGTGRCLTDDEGRYSFTTIKPGPYPWRNHRNAWRPAHVHFSLFGPEFTQRVVTQMYFPGDPLLGLDPIYSAVADAGDAARLLCSYDHEASVPEFLMAYAWDIVLTGAHRTPAETEHGEAPVTTPPTVGQTVGPFFHDALPWPTGPTLVPPGSAGAVRLTGRVLDGAGDPVPDALVELWQATPDGTVSTGPGAWARDGHAFSGFGRSATDAEGWYSFTTLAPGSTTPGRPAYVVLAVVARGLLDRLLTRAYLPGTAVDGRSGDPLLDGLPAARRSTLVCAADAYGYRFDIRLQGDEETVFLTYPRDPRA